MELKVKLLEKKIEEQNGEINVLKRTHEEFLLALNTLQQMCESDAKDIQKILKLVESRFTPTKIYNINDQLSTL